METRGWMSFEKSMKGAVAGLAGASPKTAREARARAARPRVKARPYGRERFNRDVVHDGAVGVYAACDERGDAWIARVSDLSPLRGYGARRGNPTTCVVG